MASNGDHKSGSTKKPPTPSPLRNSKIFQANMRILVTVGAGFIESHLVDRLTENEKNEPEALSIASSIDSGTFGASDDKKAPPDIPANSTQLQRDLLESSFASMNSYSPLVSYSGQISFSGSMSLRSDSNLSFAFSV